MTRYLLRRLAIAVPSLLGISLVLFTVLALAPGDPFQELASNPNVPPEVALAKMPLEQISRPAQGGQYEYKTKNRDFSRF
jgi:ABC-type dipeptide/oligopeptide/nickel transport system permease component